MMFKHDTAESQAGLFSAIVTAFKVQSYLALQQQPDPMLAAMQQISLQLSSLRVAIHPPFIKSTHPAFSPSDAACARPAPRPPPDAATVAINTLWFSSLIFSLSSASVDIMVKQWLKKFESGLPSEKTALASGGSRKGETEESARLRQYRLNNLEKCLDAQSHHRCCHDQLRITADYLHAPRYHAPPHIQAELRISLSAGGPCRQCLPLDPIHCPPTDIYCFPPHLYVYHALEP
ncbi:hypothetical protein OH77DRAFT_1150831 [Trametes cingulata]|nr:hypothetical protein OH77DRAFT_1150831 [Trametes cingulata]